MPTYEQVLAKVGGAANAPSQFTLQGLGLTADLTATLTSIYPSIDVGDVTATGTEWTSFLRFLANELYAKFCDRDVRIFQEKLGVLACSMIYAKGALGGTLGPISKGSLIPQLIRPVTVYANGGSAINNWLQAAVSAGWTKPLFTINLNAAGATINIAPQNRVVMHIIGMGDQAGSPRLFEYQWKDNAGVPLGVKTLPFMHTIQNLQVWELAESLLIPKNGQFTQDVNYESAGQSITELYGVQYVTREYATNE